MENHRLKSAFKSGYVIVPRVSINIDRALPPPPYVGQVSSNEFSSNIFLIISKDDGKILPKLHPCDPKNLWDEVNILTRQSVTEMVFHGMCDPKNPDPSRKIVGFMV